MCTIFVFVLSNTIVPEVLRVSVWVSLPYLHDANAMLRPNAKTGINFFMLIRLVLSKTHMIYRLLPDAVIKPDALYIFLITGEGDTIIKPEEKFFDTYIKLIIITAVIGIQIVGTHHFFEHQAA